jgi:hypothetical protein
VLRFLGLWFLGGGDWGFCVNCSYYDITKVPDIYDSAKYDLLHNAHLKLKGLDELYKVAKVKFGFFQHPFPSMHVNHKCKFQFS